MTSILVFTAEVKGGGTVTPGKPLTVLVHTSEGDQEVGLSKVEIAPRTIGSTEWLKAQLPKGAGEVVGSYYRPDGRIWLHISPEQRVELGLGSPVERRNFAKV